MKDKKPTAYVNFRKYAVRYDIEKHTFTYWYAPMGRIVDKACIKGVYYNGDKLFSVEDYREVSFSRLYNMDSSVLTIQYSGGPASQEELTLRFTVSKSGIRYKMECKGHLDFHIGGHLLWGSDMENNTFAVNLNRQGTDLRSGVGPASSAVDNALFDRDLDSAVEITGCATRIQFDWESKSYRFELNTEGNDYVRGFHVEAHEKVCERKFGFSYKGINKNNTFPTPPAGWMTWYAVQFRASEETVLENARWQAKNLLPFGANAFWVDWEWYHEDFSGVRTDGVNVFNPDPKRYPRGLKVVAEELKELGLVPALWIGATNEPTKNKYIEEDESVVLLQKPQWCGQYFFDLSNPKVQEEIIPNAFRQLLDWGYEALKWDCFPVTIQLHDQYHDEMHDTELTTEQAVRKVVQAARDTVGPDFFMLSCSGDTTRDILMAADIFDAMRIGGDIFKWDEFIDQCVERVMKFYALHNVVLYNDPDNVVLRPKFNTYDQALSRICFVSLLGLPITLGDNLPDLPEDRVELLRRSLPTIDAHPMDIRETVHDLSVVKLNLAINRPFEQWNVVDILNLSTENSKVILDLKEDLHLEEGKVLVYDYWGEEFLGVFNKTIPMELRPYGSRVLSIRKLLDRPQVLTTSRHITQGLVDLVDVTWDEENNILSGESNVVAGDPYEILLYMPKEMRVFYEGDETLQPVWTEESENIWKCVINPEKSGAVKWAAKCIVRHPLI